MASYYSDSADSFFIWSDRDLYMTPDDRHRPIRGQFQYQYQHLSLHSCCSPSDIWHCSTLHYTTLCRNARCCTAQHFTPLDYAAQYNSPLYTTIQSPTSHQHSRMTVDRPGQQELEYKYLCFESSDFLDKFRSSFLELLLHRMDALRQLCHL